MEEFITIRLTNVPKRAQYEFNDPQVGQEIDLQINSKTVGTIVKLGTDLPSATNAVDLTKTKHCQQAILFKLDLIFTWPKTT